MLAAALYLAPLPQRGLVGPDEPRYASIARSMAESGDWVTPFLWGEPWFEKPALLYWLGGLGESLGLEAATRLPVALLSLGFLILFHVRVRTAFGSGAATAATCILGTSAGWVAYSDAGICDLPLAAFTTAAILCLWDWMPNPESSSAHRSLPWFGGLLALAVLSKGLAALLVAFFALLPVACAKPKQVLQLAGTRTLAPFAAVCVPWYAACYWRNGQAFIDEFLIRHHIDRFFNDSLQHVQPWWFFGAVLLAFCLPWSPLLCSLRPRDLRGDLRLLSLLGWALGPLAFFSLSVNKVPSYILPVLPPLAVLAAVQWQRRPGRGLLAACGATLVLVPLAAALLPVGLSDGIRDAWASLDLRTAALSGAAGLGGAAAAVAAALRLRGAASVAAVAAVAAVLLTLLKFEAYPAVSRVAGVRELFHESAASAPAACLGEVRRHVAYGLRHYSRDAIPSCQNHPRPLRFEGDPPRLVGSPPAPEGAGAN